jgi:hypothetical protein
MLLWREAERYESSWGKYKDLVGGVTGLHVRSELGLETEEEQLADIIS